MAFNDTLHPLYTKVLAIETSCDDTSLAIVEYIDGVFTVSWTKTFSQIKLHQQFGGVMPELAYRSHAEKIVELLAPLIEQQTEEYIQAIVVTAKPGLPGSLIVGITAAYILGHIWNKPVIETHHILGHIFSPLCDRSMNVLPLPYLCLTASGGHNDLYLIQDQLQEIKSNENSQHLSKLGHIPLFAPYTFGPYIITKIGQTMDDAAGECFDKVARMLGGPYPGGKWISDLAELYLPEEGEKIIFHAGNIHDQPLLFSYSGLKSQVYNTITKHIGELSLEEKTKIAYHFQQAVCKDFIKKLSSAVQEYNITSIGICGGVAANTTLRNVLQATFDQDVYTLLFPTQLSYCTDNAAMIGVAGIIVSCMGR